MIYPHTTVILFGANLQGTTKEPRTKRPKATAEDTTTSFSSSVSPSGDTSTTEQTKKPTKTRRTRKPTVPTEGIQFLYM